MISKRALAVALASVWVAGWSTAVDAAAPPGKLVMLDVNVLSNVTDLHDADNEHLSWRELIDAGINGVHFRQWSANTQGDARFLGKAAWVEQAHEYGLWVAGGIGADHPVSTIASEGAELAGYGVDFLQIDESVGLVPGFDESSYVSIRNAVHAVDPGCPVLITDLGNNSTIWNWPSVQGLAQEVYYNGPWGYPNTIDWAVSYKNAHPSQHVMMWVWLPVRQDYGLSAGDPCTSMPDSNFDTWFNESFDKLGKIMMFIFQGRESSDPCSYAAHWSARVPTMQAKTSGFRVALPEWDGFAAAGADDGSPTLSVNVKSVAGLDPASVRALYSIDGGDSWTEWSNVSCSGSAGTKAWETITATDVPFHQVSSTLNKIRFKITDTYSGTYYRGPRTDKVSYNVDIGAIVDGGASNDGGSTSDGGSTGDGGWVGDGSATSDGGWIGDSGSTSDGGSAQSDGSSGGTWHEDDRSSSGCSCTMAGARPGPSIVELWLSSALFLGLCAYGASRARR